MGGTKESQNFQEFYCESPDKTENHLLSHTTSSPVSSVVNSRVCTGIARGQTQLFGFSSAVTIQQTSKQIVKLPTIMIYIL